MRSRVTHTITIYVGEPEPGAAEKICQAYCDEIGLCVTVTPTVYVYTNGREHGVAIGLIAYPRFPVSKDSLNQTAIILARKLLIGLKQRGVSVVFPDETIWLQGSDVGAA